MSVKPGQDDRIQQKTQRAAVANKKIGQKQILKNQVDDKVPTHSTAHLISLAEKIERLHKTKATSLGDTLAGLGEPVWKILIQLVIAAEKDQPTTIADISTRLSLPEKIVARYVGILEQKLYIAPLQHRQDQQDSELHLTDHGLSVMLSTLVALNDEIYQQVSGQ